MRKQAQVTSVTFAQEHAAGGRIGIQTANWPYLRIIFLPTVPYCLHLPY